MDSLLSFFTNIDWFEIWLATGDTLMMLGGSLLFTIVLGLPLGVLLFLCSPRQLFEQKTVYAFLSLAVNILRSLPFIILLIVMIPFTVLITGTSLGVAGAIPPLVVGATPFFARLVETALREVNEHCTDAGLKKERENKVLEAKHEVSQRQADLDKAMKKGDPEKINKRKEKLAESRKELQEALDEIDK